MWRNKVLQLKRTIWITREVTIQKWDLQNKRTTYIRVRDRDPVGFDCWPSNCSWWYVWCRTSGIWAIGLVLRGQATTCRPFLEGEFSIWKCRPRSSSLETAQVPLILRRKKHVLTSFRAHTVICQAVHLFRIQHIWPFSLFIHIYSSNSLRKLSLSVFIWARITLHCGSVGKFLHSL